MRRMVCILMILLVSAGLSHAAIIKTGDVIEIKVLSHPEFSGKYVVGEKGTIEYSLLADEVVANTTTSELMNDLTFRLARHVDNPLVLISVIENPEITITVLGQVASPGPININHGTTIQEVIQKAGGPTLFADLKRIRITRRNSSLPTEECDLRKFMEDGNLEKLPALQAGDVVVVLSQERTRKVKVIGAVQKPGLFSLDDKMNVFEIIYLAGGPAEKADLSRVRRFSATQEGKTNEEVLDIQSYMDKGQMDNVPNVNEGDVIIVYARWFDWRAVLAVLNNTLLFIVTIQAFSGVFK